MTYDYITIDIKAVTNEYLAKVRPDYEIEPKDKSLLYRLEDDIYYISLFPPEEWQELICETQEEFINAIAQHKLESLL